MAYNGADELKLARTLMPAWQAAVSEASDVEEAFAFAGVIGVLFSPAAHDDRLTADENWQAFLDVMYAKVGTLRGFGFTYEAILASHLCSSEERAFAVWHVVDDLMGKKDIDGYIQREKVSQDPADLDSEASNLNAAFAMVRHFDIDFERSQFLQSCIEYLDAALNHPREQTVDLKLRELQKRYMRERGIFRADMWRCITDISPTWSIGDNVRAGTPSEFFAHVAQMLEPVTLDAWSQVRKHGRSDSESLRWERFLSSLSSRLRARDADTDSVATFLQDADIDLIQDERIVVALQRLARAGIVNDQDRLTDVSPS
ncbi:hypothetical protein G6L37_05235 [Agrobacterium rubi]|nr:hypothetical protein [Agrobacterium rubi]NTF24760.1 hypothetical protein [Agrobacterium rubi]